MNGKGWLWLILIVVVIVAVVVVMGRQRKTRQAERADSLRSEASEHTTRRTAGARTPRSRRRARG
jgi:cytochrome c-type biogenesis protein CcmH/NrfF